MSRALNKQALQKIVRWYIAGDTGVSSESMVAVVARAKSLAHELDAPYDPADFGRCYRLVKAVPEIRGRFSDIAAAIPTFKGILDNWNQLVAIYERDLPTGKSTELHQRIRQLRGDRS
ncbi:MULTISPECIES: hypothetical protein [unclassified Burkholderia]|uniref:hypothetical protein n=1 Tax=unclassified Burkholderia TaxID=2613784 RepID=UPI000F5EAEAE|nr:MULTISPECIES: hypothetical protein [unclassified Burkholderia]